MHKKNPRQVDMPVKSINQSKEKIYIQLMD